MCIATILGSPLTLYYAKKNHPKKQKLNLEKDVHAYIK